jgi:pyrroline-5-carboxylate reductase
MKIMIVGCGNIGGSILRGLLAGNQISAKDIVAVDSSHDTLDKLRELNSELAVSFPPTEAQVKATDVLILAVKPWQIQSVINNLKFQLDYEEQTIVSVAAGISFDQLKSFLKKESDGKPALFRVMPNTAIAIRQSMTFIASHNADEKLEMKIQGIFDELGKTILIPENQMSAATLLASCGTAFAMRYIRAAMEGGIELGFYSQMAKDIVLQTVKGAVDLLLANGTHPEEEIDKVTTPGGLTIKGLNEMEHAGFSSAVIRGLKIGD